MFNNGNNKNVPEKSASKKNTLIFDYLARNEKDLDSYRALYIYLHKLQNQRLKTMQRQAMIETFENVVKKVAARFSACRTKIWSLFLIRKRMTRFWPAWSKSVF